MFYELRWYLFLVKEPKKYVGHNPLAQLMMFLFFTIGAVVHDLHRLCAVRRRRGPGQLGGSNLFGWVIPLIGGTASTCTAWHHLGMWVM